MLNPGTSFEKTDDGFTFRLNAGDPGEKIYQIIYGKKG